MRYADVPVRLNRYTIHFIVALAYQHIDALLIWTFEKVASFNRTKTLKASGSTTCMRESLQLQDLEIYFAVHLENRC